MLSGPVARWLTLASAAVASATAVVVPPPARLWIGALALLLAGAAGGAAVARQRSRREPEALPTLLFETHPQPMWVYDLETLQFLAVNDAAVAHYGWTRDQFLRMTIADIRPPADVPRLRAHLAARRTNAPFGRAGLWRHVKADGSLIDVEIAAHRIEFGGRLAALVMVHDVTERLRAERQVLEANAAHRQALSRFRALIEASPTILYTLAADVEGLPATWVSDNIARILGHSVQAALAPGWWARHLHPEDRERARAINAAILARRELVQEYRFRDGQGCYRVIRDEMRVVPGPDGRDREIVGAWTDMTAQREAESRRDLLLAALEATANAIIVTGTDGRIEWANPAFATLTGYTLEEAVGRTPGELLRSGAHDDAFYAALWATIAAGHVWQGEIVNRRKDGSRYTEETTIAPVRGRSGAVTHFVAVKQDVTERNQLRAELLQAQRMESVGRLAGGIAHDFNNLLTVINNFAELAIEDLPEDHPLRGALFEIRRAGERAAGLTRQLLAFSRKQVLQPQDVDLNLVVGDMEKMLRRLIGEDVALEVRPWPVPVVVHADRSQIEQVLLNLSVNARDAMPAGGTLTIETRLVDLDAVAAAGHPGLRPGRWALLVVHDTGHGMDETTRARLFEPFFTTKPQGKGTGLGLPTVYGIVQQSGGVIWVETAPGQGARFTIALPHVEAAADTGRLVEATAPARGGETILIVEDDDLVRDLTRHVLASAGYRTYAAASGESALLLLDELEEPVDLLLTDVVMPGLTGRELAERVQARSPATRVLYMSGYTGDAIVREGQRHGRVPLVSKPFTRGTILRAVRDALDHS